MLCVTIKQREHRPWEFTTYSWTQEHFKESHPLLTVRSKERGLWVIHIDTRRGQWFLVNTNHVAQRAFSQPVSYAFCTPLGGWSGERWSLICRCRKHRGARSSEDTWNSAFHRSLASPGPLPSGLFDLICSSSSGISIQRAKYLAKKWEEMM